MCEAYIKQSFVHMWSQVHKRLVPLAQDGRGESQEAALEEVTRRSMGVRRQTLGQERMPGRGLELGKHRKETLSDKAPFEEEQNLRRNTML